MSVLIHNVMAVIINANILVWLCIAVPNGINHSPPTLNGAPSPPQRFSNAPASSSSLTNQQLPATCGARQLSKLKRFLTTLQQFGNDISPEIGEKVRTLVLALVVSTFKNKKTPWNSEMCSNTKPLYGSRGPCCLCQSFVNARNVAASVHVCCTMLFMWFWIYGNAIYQASLNSF